MPLSLQCKVHGVDTYGGMYRSMAESLCSKIKGLRNRMTELTGGGSFFRKIVWLNNSLNLCRRQLNLSIILNQTSNFQ